jgi:ATP-dependent RNA helicase DBP3
MGGQADDEVSAKKLIKKALKKGSVPLAALRTSVVAALVASGKDEKKAKKMFEAKVALPIFSIGSNGTVSLASSQAEPASVAPAATGKRPATEAPAAKNAKKGGAAAPAAASAAGSSSVTMMSPAEAAKYCAEHSVTLTGGGADAFRPIATFAASGFTHDALASTAKFARPTPIQAVCWPIIAASRDVIGVAETGSGKTLAFFLPAISLIRAAGRSQNSSGENVLMLCLEPTRELAMQTEVVCASAGGPCGIRSICVYGGVPKGPQLSALRGGAQVVIATPGRLLDLHQNDRVCDLSTVQYLVLDEVRLGSLFVQPR